MRTTRIKTVVAVFLLMASNGLFAQCREVNLTQLTQRLKSLIEPSINIVLDRDNSEISLVGSTERFTLPAENISKPAHDWRYWVQDIRSDDSNFWWDENRNHFVLDVRFEGNGSEIKGTCPGCLVGNNDKRAPDINWKGARLARLRMRPIPYEGSVTIEVLDVELFGEFDLNGFLESIFPRMVRNMENKMKTRIEAEANQILNNPSRRRDIANILRPILEAMGIRNVRRISRSRDGRSVLFCS